MTVCALLFREPLQPRLYFPAIFRSPQIQVMTQLRRRLCQPFQPYEGAGERQRRHRIVVFALA